MEILSTFIIFIMLFFIIKFFITESTYKQNHTDSQSNKNLSSPAELNEKSNVNHIETDFLPKEKPSLNQINNSSLKDDNNTIVNNYFIKNELHVHNTTQASSDKECKDHTEKIWKELGYRIKSGETCSYKLYGREVFTPEQVVKKGVHTYSPDLLGTGRTKNQKKVKALGFSLIEKYGSKRKAKIILVEEYDFDEDTAKYATGYQGYDDY